MLDVSLTDILALHELDPVFRDATLNNQKLKDLAQDLQFHSNPLGEQLCSLLPSSHTRKVLQSMVICKQPQIGGKGRTRCLPESSLKFFQYPSTTIPRSL